MRAQFWVALACLLLAGSLSHCQDIPSLTGEVTFIEDPMEGDCAIEGDLAVSAGDHVQFVLDYQDDGTCYLLDITAPDARFYKLSPNGSRAIGPPGKLLLATPGEAQVFTVSRKNHRLRLIYEGQVACGGWDGSLTGGKAGHIAADGRVAEARVQPFGPIKENDDFVREQDAQSMWSPVSGSWQTESLRDDDQADEMEADKSANAFSYRGVSADVPALALASQDMWFWTDYRISASARQMGDGAMGLVLLAQDEQNYILMRWASSWDTGDRGARIELAEVIGGDTTILAEKPGGFLPDQWYALSAAICDGHIICTVDGTPVLEGYTDRFGQGSAGLYAEGDDGAYFDDVVIADFELLNDDLDSLERWQTASGNWSNSDGQAQSAGAGVLWSGRYEWTRYGVEAIASSKGGAVGIQLARQADGAGVLVRVTPASGKAEIVKTSADGEEILAEASTKIAKGKPLALAATVLDRGFVTGYVNDEPVIEALYAGLASGAVGLYAGGPKEARFDAVRVAFIERRQGPQITKEFSESAEHPEMGPWAGRRQPWIEPAEAGRGATWWTKGDYYGDMSLAFKVRFIGLRDGSVTLTLEGDPEVPDKGLKLAFSATKGSKILTVTLTRDGEHLDQVQVELAKSSCKVEVSNLLLIVDGQPLMARGL